MGKSHARNKHILFIVENGGVPGDKRVWREALAAKELGYEVSVICSEKGKMLLNSERLKGIDIYRHSMPVEADGIFAFLFEYANALFWEILLSLWIFIKKPFHYIHAANPPDNIFIIALIFKLFGTRYIFDHHDLCPEFYLSRFDRKDFFFRLLLLFEKFSFKVADIVISTNESYKNIAISRGHKHKEAVFVVRNGPNLSQINSMKPNVELKRKLEHLVAYIGMIGKQERIDVLLRAVQYIVYEKKIKNIKFVIIGSGPQLENMVQLSKHMNLGKYVKFTGYIHSPDYYDILSTADICLNPEFRNEYTDKSTMIKIMEYMASGKPIVQFETTEGKTSAGAAAIYVLNNDEVEFAEAIIHLLKDRQKRERMGEIGKQRIYEKLSWDKQKINLKNAYDYLEAKG